MIKTRNIIRRSLNHLDSSHDDADILRAIYAHRHEHEPSSVNYSLTNLQPYHSLLNIDAAARLLADCIDADKKLLVIGDYDADGATSTALAMLSLGDLGARHVDFLVPNRFDFGYGLSKEIVDYAYHEKQPDVLITVDNGIANIEGVDRARALGMQVLITDHHLPGDTLPDADCIVNPNLPDDPFPSKNLAGVGVIFYVMLALRAELERRGCFDKAVKPNLAKYLDLVALGTVADVVPLDFNNRLLVENGLKRIRSGACRPGITALLNVSGREQGTVVASDLGFAVGPRINAAGRLDDISLGIACLISEHVAKAVEWAEVLDHMNQERRAIEGDMQEEAVHMLAHFNESQWEKHFALALYQPSWHQGVIGILASRIKERVYRPVITFAQDGENRLKGSGRSIAGIHMRDCLDLVDKRLPGAIIKFGGHAMAAGLTLHEGQLAAFTRCFNDVVQTMCDGQYLTQDVRSDGALSGQQLRLSLAERIRYAGPWGQEFEEPVFDGEFFVISKRLLKNKHLKLVLSQNRHSNDLLDGMWFNIDADLFDQIPEQVRIAYRLDVNHFRSEKNLQLIIEHLEWDQYNGKAILPEPTQSAMV